MNKLVAILIAMVMFVVALQEYEFSCIEKRINELEAYTYSLKSELNDYRDKCQRNTDTCISILSRGEW